MIILKKAEKIVEQLYMYKLKWQFLVMFKSISGSENQIILSASLFNSTSQLLLLLRFMSDKSINSNDLETVLYCVCRKPPNVHNDKSLLYN